MRVKFIFIIIIFIIIFIFKPSAKLPRYRSECPEVLRKYMSLIPQEKLNRIKYAKENKLKSIVNYEVEIKNKLDGYKESLDFYEEYDAYGNIIKSIRYCNVKELKNIEYKNEEYTFDAFGNELSSNYKFYENELNYNAVIKYYGNKSIYESRQKVSTDLLPDNEEIFTEEIDYNQLGNIVSSKSKLDNNTSRKLSYLYDSENKLIKIYDWINCTCIGGTTQEILFDYDSNKTIISEKRYDNHDPFEKFKLINEKYYEYNSNKYLTKIIEKDNKNSLTQTCILDYDSKNRFTKICEQIVQSKVPDFNRITYFLYDDICYCDYQLHKEDETNIIKYIRTKYEYY